jgi:hypothetical protein
MKESLEESETVCENLEDAPGIGSTPLERTKESETDRGDLFVWS